MIRKIIPKKLKELIRQTSFFRKYNNKKRALRYIRYVVPVKDIDIAVASTQNKEAFIDKYSKLWPERIFDFLKHAEGCLKSRGVRSLEIDKDLKREMLFCFIAYGFSADEFLIYSLLDKSERERNEYVSDRDLMIMVYKLNDSVEIETFNNKAKTYSVFKEFYKRDAVGIKMSADFPKFKDFIESRKEVVIKPVGEAMGRGIELVSTERIRLAAQGFFEDLISHGEYLIEEKVVQNSAMSEFNESTVNTIRIITFNIGHEIIIPYCFLKAGRKGSFVDNGGAGGILVGADIKTGVTNTDGIDENGHAYVNHPDSGKRFKGFQLPDYNSAIILCKKMSSMVSKIRYIGWDLAYTNNGWIVIEGNGMSQLIGPQATQGRGVKQEIDEIVKDVKPAWKWL